MEFRTNEHQDAQSSLAVIEGEDSSSKQWHSKTVTRPKLSSRYKQHLLDETKLELRDRIRHALIESLFSKMSWWQEEYYQRLPEIYEKAVLNHTFRRYNQAMRSVVPWVEEVRSLDATTILEVGCGNGNATAAFAQLCGHITGYDINPNKIAGARSRVAAMALDNVDLIALPPAKLSHEMRRKASNQPIDIILLYAVLEHQTLEERLETLALSWDLLALGGLLVVVETPNRLIYQDRHTSNMPFFHMLPLDLQIPFSQHSSREEFRDNIAHHAASSSQDEMRELMVRWGQSVSFHEFQHVLGDLKQVVASDGISPWMQAMKPETFDEHLLWQFMQYKNMPVSKGFSRHYLNLIFQKIA